MTDFTALETARAQLREAQTAEERLVSRARSGEREGLDELWLAIAFAGAFVAAVVAIAEVVADVAPKIVDDLHSIAYDVAEYRHGR